uniref:Dynein light chain n=1 Tax=Parascaris univalens TaxID=6257 RepID=A0A914ZNY6_PARUN
TFMSKALAQRLLLIPSVSSTDSGQGTSREGAFKRLFTYPLVRRSDMEEEMRKEAIKIVAKECEKNSDNNQSAARAIKETLDGRYGGPWHAVVGEEFGLQLSHDPETLLYLFFGGNLAICVWKCT